MLKIVVVDTSAESRGKLVDRLHTLLAGAGPALELLPRIDIRPSAPEEIRFQEAPQLCIVGPTVIKANLVQVGTFRSQWPESPLVACLAEDSAELSTIEQLSRYGIDDIITLSTTAPEFLRRLVLLCRKSRKTKAGRLIVVDSGKGGLGVTSLAAALADAFASRGSKVTLVDFDTESQDLSRFIQARPFINESLQLLFDRQRPVSEEFVEQSIVHLWEHGRGSLSCMPPVPESEKLYGAESASARILISVFEILDFRSHFVIVDVGSARGALLRTLYRIADSVLFVVSNDPAALYASTNRFTELRGYLAPGAQIRLLINSLRPRGLRSKALVNEFARTVGIHQADWLSTTIPYCAVAERWPGSGSTLFSLGKRSLKSSIDKVISSLSTTTEMLLAAESSGLPRGLLSPAKLLVAPISAFPGRSEIEEAKLLISPAVVS